MKKGLFIAIEGLDGTGKTKHIEGLSMRLAEVYPNVKATKEPSSGAIGNFIREHNFDGMTLACLVAADRSYHLEYEIIPLLENDYIVITDRYVASSYICQQLDGIDVETIKQLNSMIIMPDINVFLKADENIVQSRLSDRDFLSRMEKDYSFEETFKLFEKTIKMMKNDGYKNIMELHSNTEEDYLCNINVLVNLAVKLLKKKK